MGIIITELPEADQLQETDAFIIETRAGTKKILPGNISIDASNVSGTFPNGTEAVTQPENDDSQKLATTGFVQSAAANIMTEVDNKVDKVSGKGLSTNDYTTTEKNKLSGIASGAEVNQNAFSNIKVDTTTIAADTKTDTLTLVPGTNITITPDATNDKITIANGYSLPTASSSKLGGIKVGSNLSISNGVLSATDTVYSDATTSAHGLMSASDKSKLNNIESNAEVNIIETIKVNNTAVPVSNKAVNIDLTNYATKSDISSVYKYKGSVTNYSNLPTTGLSIGDVYNVVNADATHGIKAGDNVAWTGSVWDVLAGTVDLTPYAKKNELANVATTGSYNSLSNKPTMLSQFSNDVGYITQSAISEKENTSNKVTSISASSTNTSYPSAKAVYDLFTSITNGDEVMY